MQKPRDISAPVTASDAAQDPGAELLGFWEYQDSSDHHRAKQVSISTCAESMCWCHFRCEGFVTVGVGVVVAVDAVAAGSVVVAVVAVAALI